MSKSLQVKRVRASKEVKKMKKVLIAIGVLFLIVVIHGSLRRQIAEHEKDFRD